MNPKGDRCIKDSNYESLFEYGMSAMECIARLEIEALSNRQIINGLLKRVSDLEKINNAVNDLSQNDENKEGQNG